MAFCLSFQQCMLFEQRHVYFTDQDAMWSEPETRRLELAIHDLGTNRWDAVADLFLHKTAIDCQERYNRLVWTGDEDHTLGRLIAEFDTWYRRNLLGGAAAIHQDDKWRIISLQMEHKDPMQCYNRWKLIRWTQDEDVLLRLAVATFGRNRWWFVATYIKTKADWQCKARWVELNGSTSDGKS